MTTRIEKILSNARVTLADKQKERWTDSDLLTILDEGHKDLCRHTKILRDRVTINIELNNPYLQLPEDVWLLTRIVYKNAALPLISHTELDGSTLSRYNIDFGIDSGSFDWETETGEPLAVIYDRRNMSELKLYPIPDASVIAADYVFNSTGTPPTPVPTDSQVSGVTDEIDDFTSTYDFGLLAAADGSTVEPFGVVSEILDSEALTIYYIKNPPDLASIGPTLLTPPMFDTALKYYVVGHAFLNDINEEYQAKGTQQLGFYERELGIAEETNTSDSTRAAQFGTTYRGAF